MIHVHKVTFGVGEMGLCFVIHTFLYNNSSLGGGGG